MQAGFFGLPRGEHEGPKTQGHAQSRTFTSTRLTYSRIHVFAYSRIHLFAPTRPNSSPARRQARLCKNRAIGKPTQNNQECGRVKASTSRANLPSLRVNTAVHIPRPKCRSVVENGKIGPRLVPRSTSKGRLSPRAAVLPYPNVDSLPNHPPAVRCPSMDTHTGARFERHLVWLSGVEPRSHPNSIEPSKTPAYGPVAGARGSV